MLISRNSITLELITFLSKFIVSSILISPWSLDNREKRSLRLKNRKIENSTFSEITFFFFFFFFLIEILISEISEINFSDFSHLWKSRKLTFLTLRQLKRQLFYAEFENLRKTSLFIWFWTVLKMRLLSLASLHKFETCLTSNDYIAGNGSF